MMTCLFGIIPMTIIIIDSRTIVTPMIIMNTVIMMMTWSIIMEGNVDDVVTVVVVGNNHSYPGRKHFWRQTYHEEHPGLLWPRLCAALLFAPAVADWSVWIDVDPLLGVCSRRWPSRRKEIRLTMLAGSWRLAVSDHLHWWSTEIYGREKCGRRVGKLGAKPAEEPVSERLDKRRAKMSPWPQSAAGLVGLKPTESIYRLCLTPLLPWCRLKTTNKRAKFETLKSFCLLFPTAMWKDFHQNVWHWK